MDGKHFLDNYYMGIDTESKKPILLTVEQMLVILNTYKRVLDEKQKKQIKKTISISKEKKLHTQDEIFCDVLSDLKENNVVAFKEKKRNKWFTGVISCIAPPNEKRPEYFIIINLNVPIEPQWYDGEQTVYYLDDICDLIILENIT